MYYILALFFFLLLLRLTHPSHQPNTSFSCLAFWRKLFVIDESIRRVTLASSNVWQWSAQGFLLLGHEQKNWWSGKACTDASTVLCIVDKPDEICRQNKYLATIRRGDSFSYIGGNEGLWTSEASSSNMKFVSLTEILYQRNMEYSSRVPAQPLWECSTLLLLSIYYAL